MHSSPDRSADVTVRVVAATWWPLAASWLFMALEGPVVSAILARLPDPEIQLAALGGVVYPLMLLIESPVIMLLAASTALSKDWASYQSLRRYMNGMSLALTALHAAIAFTPLWDFVAVDLIDAPAEILGPARFGVAVSLPWTWSIAYRRFNQGVLIRHGASYLVGIGTGIRLISTAGALLLFVAFGLGRGPEFPGVAAGVSAIIVGVVAEAIFVGIMKRPVVEQHFDPLETVTGAVGPRKFAAFYIPLALTSLLGLMSQPMGSAAISRMPLPIQSLAAWPIVIGIIFVLRSAGTAYKEVVVALLDRAGADAAVRRFTWILAGGLGAVTAVIALTPVSGFLLREVFGLHPEVAAIARQGLRWGVILPAAGALQNLYIGILVHRHETRAVTESMALFLAVSAGILAGGVISGQFPGLVVGYVAFSLANLVQLFWVWRASRLTATTA